MKKGHLVFAFASALVLSTAPYADSPQNIAEDILDGVDFSSTDDDEVDVQIEGQGEASVSSDELFAEDPDAEYMDDVDDRYDRAAETHEDDEALLEEAQHQTSTFRSEGDGSAQATAYDTIFQEGSRTADRVTDDDGTLTCTVERRPSDLSTTICAGDDYEEREECQIDPNVADNFPVMDTSGRGNHGVVIGNMTFQERGLWFGSAHDFVELPTGSFNPTNEFESISLSTWIKWDGLTGNVSGIWGADGSGSGIGHFEINRTGAGDLRLRLANMGPTSNYFRVPNAISVGEWTHVGATYNAENCRARLYINGQIVNERVGECAGTLRWDSWHKLGNSHVASNDRGFDGTVDEFTMWDREVSPDEMAALMNQSPEPGEDGLVGMWSMDDFRVVGDRRHESIPGCAEQLEMDEECELVPGSWTCIEADNNRTVGGIPILPDIAERDLSPLYPGDDHNPVCWKAQATYQCPTDPYEGDDEVTDPCGTGSDDLFDFTYLRECDETVDQFNQEFTDQFEDCEEVEVTEEVETTRPVHDEVYCHRPNSDTGWGPCSTQRTVVVDTKEEQATDEDGNPLFDVNGDPIMIEVDYIAEDSWQQNTCLQAAQEWNNDVGDYCTSNIDYDAPNCQTFGDHTICQGDDLYYELATPPGGFGNRLTTEISFDEIHCATDAGDVDDICHTENGETVCGTPSNQDGCTQYEADSDYTFIRETCSHEADTTVASWCQEVERTYEVEVGERTDTRTIHSIETECAGSDISCADGSCITQEQEADDGFEEAAALMSAVDSMASHMECDGSNPDTCRIWEGEEQRCRRGRGEFSSVWDCCDHDAEEMIDEDGYVESIIAAGREMGENALELHEGLMSTASQIVHFLVPCYDEEYELAVNKDMEHTVRLGSRCGRSISLGFTSICIRRDHHYCSYPSSLARIVMEGANDQLGRSFGSPRSGNCQGLTIEEVQNLDWSELDLTEWKDKMMDTGNMPPEDIDADSFDPADMDPSTTFGNE